MKSLLFNFVTKAPPRPTLGPTACARGISTGRANTTGRANYGSPAPPPAGRRLFRMKVSESALLPLGSVGPFSYLSRDPRRRALTPRRQPSLSVPGEDDSEERLPRRRARSGSLVRQYVSNI